MRFEETFATELSEVTLEADPETVEAGKAAAWVRAGINRVSFGLAVVFGQGIGGVGADAPAGGYLSGGADFARSGDSKYQF